MRNILLVCLAALSAGGCFGKNGGVLMAEADTGVLEVTHLRVEAVKDPAGIDIEKPKFSWRLAAAGRGIKQTAYEVKVFAGKKEGWKVWDTGKIPSEQSIDIQYHGEALRPSTRYYWEVSVWDNRGNKSTSSEPAYFETGLMHTGWIGAQWIKASSRYGETCVTQNDSPGIPIFRKEFDAKNAVKSTKLYTTALGVYDVFINGTRVGTILPDGTTRYDELKPGWTDYFKEVFYLSYDVTPLVRQGDNAIGAQLASGWWAGAIAHGIYGSPSPGFMAKLIIEYKDGDTETVVTDTSWKCSFDGPVLLGDIYNGETYDARKESNWASAGFDDSQWYSSALHTEFNGKISAFCGPPVQVREELKRIPQSIRVYENIRTTGTTYGMIDPISTLNNGTLPLKKGQTAIYDMGQNMVGWIKFTVKGETGTKLRFRFGEMLNDNGDAGRSNDGPGGSVYTYNLRTAKARLNYILRGKPDGETYQPSTTFFGFRYCEVTATGDVEITNLTGEVVGSVIEEGSSFTTSHKDINQLYSNILWSQRGNFLSVPTDCPQRDERLGWTGDTQIFCRAAIYNADTRAFYHKWMGDMRNSQRADGAYPDIAPYCWFGFGNAAWGDAGIIVPWTVYLMYGDKSILEENYESMTRYMNFLSDQKNDDYDYNGAGTSFGDWIAYEQTDARFVSVCYYAYAAQLMEKISKAMSSAENDYYAVKAGEYTALYNNIKKEFEHRYILSGGRLRVETQTAYLLALKMDLFPDRAAQDNALSLLRNKIINNGYKLSTGFVGTGILNQTLSRYNQHDLAYGLLLQRDNPSWLYSVDQGATTIWERWDSYVKEKGFNDHPWIMNSFNHYAYGTVLEWLFRYAGGIEADEENPGFKHFILQPVPDDRTWFPQNQQRIDWVNAVYNSCYGDIVSSWNRKADGRISYTAVVPANTTATLYFPVAARTDEIYEGEDLAVKAEGVEYLRTENNKAVFKLQSGTYHFDVRP
jgi:alpha-L-rhamnosidase